MTNKRATGGEWSLQKNYYRNRLAGCQVVSRISGKSANMFHVVCRVSDSENAVENGELLAMALQLAHDYVLLTEELQKMLTEEQHKAVEPYMQHADKLRELLP